jgi:hypothetical protein
LHFTPCVTPPLSPPHKGDADTHETIRKSSRSTLVTIPKTGGETKMSDKKYPQAGMPKWLIYTLVAKGVIVILITVAVLWYAGIIG